MNRTHDLRYGDARQINQYPVAHRPGSPDYATLTRPARSRSVINFFRRWRARRRMSSGHPNTPDAPLLTFVPLPLVLWVVPGIWTAFRRLELTCPINSDECLLILRDCPRLIYFALTLAEVVRNPPSAACSFDEARSLCSLTIKSSCGTEQLFMRLRLPRLTSLHLSFDPLVQPPTDVGLLSLISKSDCHLDTLSLRDVFLGEAELLLCLTAVNGTLRELVVRNDRNGVEMSNGRMVSSDTVLYLTNANPTSWDHCPKLTTLALSRCACSDSQLATMVNSRLPTIEFNFTYSFLDPLLDSQFLAAINDIGSINLTRLIHEL